MISKEKINNIVKYLYIILPFAILFLIVHRCEVLKNKKLEKEVQNNYNMMRVLTDSMHTYKNKNNELVYYKNVFQNDMKTMKKNYDLMSENQKALYKEVKDTKKLISAFRGQMEVSINDLKNDKGVVNVDSTNVTFKDSTENITYDITIDGVKPIATPSLSINEITLPNTQTITYTWVEDGGVKVDVKNSNKYIKMVDVDGYIIPQVTEEITKPKFFKKVWDTTKKVLVGVVVGGVIVFTYMVASN